MARVAYCYEVPNCVVGGLPVTVSANLLQLVQRIAQLDADMWWQEIERRIAEVMSRRDNDMKFLVPVPMLEGLVLQCEVAHDEFGWHLCCDTTDDAFFKLWLDC